MQKLAGLITESEYKEQMNEDETDLLAFIKQNQDEIANEVGATSLKDIMIDDLGDVGATGIYEEEGEDYEIEGGLAFRFPEDVDGDFVGENGDKPMSLNINGVELMYVGYNI
jgi:hypothetical protein